MSAVRPDDAVTFWCHNCKGWRTAALGEFGVYECCTCGDEIQCDECGARLTDEHLEVTEH